jgi:cell division protein FtsQ
VALALLAGLVLAGYRLWLRDSTLVAVRSVNVVGASGPDAERIRAALDAAGREMTTLHVREAALRDAVRPFPLVRTVTVETSFPSGLTIRVIERRIAALAQVGGKSVPVSDDAVLLPGARAVGRLPEISLSVQSRRQELRGEARDAALALGAAPPALRAHVKGASSDEDGIVVALRRGPELIFGDASRAAAKWAAAARLLAEPDLGGVAYIDLRTPERPAAGGVQGAVQPVETP